MLVKPTAGRNGVLIACLRFHFFPGRLLPEHVDLGLRLTVGEDVLQKPLFESTRGDGKFPDALANKSGRLSSNGEGQENPYFPSLTAGGPGGLPGESM